MTKDQAKKLKYCNHCAAFYRDRQHCGILAEPADKDQCILGLDVVARWKAEYGLERENHFDKKWGSPRRK